MSLAPREKQVLEIIAEYLKYRNQQCFSYEGIYAFYEQHYRDALPATTLDRTIRRLVEKGLLERRRVKALDTKPTTKTTTVIFCWTSEAEKLYLELRRERKHVLEAVLERLGIPTHAPRASGEVAFYATGAPEWWPYQLVSLTHRIVPRRGYRLLHDNNAFKFFASGRWPDIDRWIYTLLRSVYRYAGVVDEVLVILPDKPMDPRATLEWAYRAYGRICTERNRAKGIKCVAVAHFDPQSPSLSIRETVKHILDTMPDVDIIAAPLKLYCSRSGKNRRVTDPLCQLGIVARVYDAVSGKLPVHGLGIMLNRELLKRATPFLHSFDSTGWTRTYTPTLKRLGFDLSAKNSSARELYFAVAVALLKRDGIPVRDAELALQHIPQQLQKTLGLS